MKQTFAHREVPSYQTPGRIVFILAAATAIDTAHAQSIGLYGIVDTGIEYVSDAGPERSNSFRMPTLSASIPSRWGLRGKEDIGGGQSAVFLLESGFGPAQGTLNQGGRLFGRQAYAGLTGSWGTITLGRQYSQIFWALIGDTMGPNVFSAGNLDAYLSNARMDNAIVYTGRFSTLTVGITYSLGRDGTLPAAAGGCAGESPADWKALQIFFGNAEVRYRLLGCCHGV